MQNKSDVYTPAEDTFFLADNIIHERGSLALEIGTGSGYLAKILENNFDLVVGTDIDFCSLISQENKVKNRICCSGADSLDAKFDLVVCNLPYLPSDQILDRTVDGGYEGLEEPLKIIKSASNCIKQHGRMVYLTSSLANHEKLVEKTKSFGFSVKILATKKLFFEELIIVEAIKLFS